MHRESRKSSGRFLAPLALGLVVAAFLFVIATSGGSSKDTNKSGSTDTTAQKTSTTSGTRTRPRKSAYTVKTGDTLGAIAAKVGLTVEKLQELNPDLDPQALVSGQKIKLRE